MQAVTFDWRLIVRPREEKTVVCEVQTDGITVAAASRQHGKAKQCLTFVEINKKAIDNNNEGFGSRNVPQDMLSQPLCPTAKDSYVYPWDKSDLKTLHLNLQDFKTLDDYASKVKAKSSTGDLVTALLKKANNDLEKVRAIWIWICYHIEYDIEGLRDKAQCSANADQLLRMGKANCAGYATLFEQMCRLAGVECVQLSGFAKGCSYKSGQPCTQDDAHAWNAVHLSGKWHFVDSTWGAGFTTKNSNAFVFEYNEFYFLTHPALFAEAHFPDNKNWQLLKSPLSMQRFENNIHRRSTFYTTGLTAAYPEAAIIGTVNGKATFTLESCSPTHFIFTLNGKEGCGGIMTLKKNGMKLDIFPQNTGCHKLTLYARPDSPKSDSYDNVLEYILECSSVDKKMKLPRELDNPVGHSWLIKQRGILLPSHREPIIHSTDGCCTVSFSLEKQMAVNAMLYSDEVPMTKESQKKHILQVQHPNRVEFRVQVPKAGIYVFKIFADSKSDPGHFEAVCNYIISCKNTKVQWPIFPVQMCNPVGPSLLMEEKGILQSSHMEPIIHTTDGRCSVSFTLKNGVCILALLCSNAVTMTKEMGSRYILQVQKKNQVELKVQLPQSGSYVLKIYREKTACRGIFEYAGNYLIYCTNAEVKWPPYPTRLQNPVGPNNVTEEKGLLQPSHQEPIIYTTDGRCSVSFTLEKDINILAILHSDELVMTEQVERRHILQVQHENRIEFIIQLPKASTYVLKIYVDCMLEPGQFKYVCNYLLCCTNINVSWPAFPTMLQNPVGPTRLTKQKGLIQPSHSNPIIYTSDGHCKLSFSLSRHVEAFAILQSDDIIIEEDFEGRHILQIQKNNRIDFNVYIPQSGSYVLKIYADDDKDRGKMCFACNYLIICTSTVWPEFPGEVDNPQGPNQ